MTVPSVGNYYCGLTITRTRARFVFAGQVHVEKRRLVVRSHPVGDTDVLQPPAAGGADQRTGGGERQPHVPGQRQAQVCRTTAQLPARNVRNHGRVLEARRIGPTEVLGDPPVPATQELRVHTGDMIGHALLPAHP